MFVYRLEDNQGLGPWSTNEQLSAECWDLAIIPGVYVNPAPIPEDYLCGCQSIRQLLTWFPKEFLQALPKGRWFLAEYETSDFKIWDNQVIFKGRRTRRQPV